MSDSDPMNYIGWASILNTHIQMYGVFDLGLRENI